MQSSTRIILNTLASYGRSLFAIATALFSVRWTLEALGQVDFGLFGLVGSLIALMNLLNAGLAAGVTRFYAFAIGEGKNEASELASDKLMRWFNAAFSIHLVVAVVFILIGWPIGEYAIQNWLIIPDDRVYASLIVFRVSLVSAFMMVFSVPFVSMYTAHQRITELSFFGILQSTALLILSWCLLSVSSDRLIVYACVFVAITSLLRLTQIIRSFIHFPACRVRFMYMYDRSYIRKLFSFSGWKMLGMAMVTLRLQGTPMLINMKFGPIVNAAYAVAFSLSSKVTNLSDSLTNSFRPAVISAEGEGDRVGMLKMALITSKFGSIMIIIFAVPLIIEMNYVLEWWLSSPPQYVAPICQWLLAMLIVDRMTTGHMLAVNAKGKIALYEVIQGFTLFSALPLMWLFFKMGSGPVGVGIALFISMTVYCVGRIIFAKHLLDFPVKPWLNEVGFPVFGLIVVVFLIGALSSNITLLGFWHIVFTSVTMALGAFLFSWKLIFNQDERNFVRNGVNKVMRKFC